MHIKPLEVRGLDRGKKSELRTDVWRMIIGKMRRDILLR